MRAVHASTLYQRTTATAPTNASAVASAAARSSCNDTSSSTSTSAVASAAARSSCNDTSKSNICQYLQWELSSDPEMCAALVELCERFAAQDISTENGVSSMIGACRTS